MIFILEQALRSTITGLNFIERYGGIVRPVTRMGMGEEDKPYSDVFPVSCYVSEADCFDGSRERDLVPNEAYKSVAYWEPITGSSIIESGPRGNQWMITLSMRFACWLNFAKLGMNDCHATDLIELYLIKQVHAQHGQVKTISGYTFRVDVAGFRSVQRAANVVFAPYTYAGQQWAFSWPYGFFAVDFQFKLQLAAGCITAPVLGDEISCITTW